MKATIPATAIKLMTIHMTWDVFRDILMVGGGEPNGRPIGMPHYTISFTRT